MCRFASFVVTKEEVFWLERSDSHSGIIAQHKLHEWGARGPNVVKVELTPGVAIKKWPSLAKWDFKIDQDKLPEWASREEIERRSRTALKRRAKAGFLTIDARGCTALTELKADAAKHVDARGCTALTGKWAPK